MIGLFFGLLCGALLFVVMVIIEGVKAVIDIIRSWPVIKKELLEIRNR
jgi:hypothetical protein